jgi:hypothetical protein
MHRSRVLRRAMFCLIGLGLSLALVQTASAQAWTPRKGQTSLGVIYQYLDAGDHLTSTDVIIGGVNLGDSFDLGDITAHTGIVAVDYGLSDRWALSGGLAYVSSRYVGPFPESARDEGEYNGEFQDLRLNARYRATDGAVAVTPFVGIVLPTHGYDIVGHSSVGRGLTELHFGAVLGWFQSSTGFYLQGGYTYALVESVLDLNLDRSELSFEVGYFINRSWSIRGFTGYRHTHGGIDWVEDDLSDPGIGHTHDQAAALKDLRAGLGTNVKLTWNMNFFFDYSMTVEGENTHEVNIASLGLTWTLGGANIGRTARRIGSTEAPKPGEN